METILGLSYAAWGVILAALAVVGTFAGVYYTRRQAKQVEKTERQAQAAQDTLAGSSPPPPPPANPALATHFVDRPDLISKIMQAISPGGSSLGPRTAIISSLRGMGGVGKTELAREVARGMKSQCPGGVAEVNLRGWDSKQPMEEEEALRSLCAQLDPDFDAKMHVEKLTPYWQRLTSGRRALVILDNLKDSGLINALRPADGITLVTSRTSNLVTGVPGIDVGVMEPAEAAALARQNCPQLSEADALALAKAVGHLPLAVEIAAQRLNDSGESVAALAERLADPGRAARVLKGDTDQEDVLLRVLEWSLGGLSDGQKRRWQALSLPPGDFGLWTVQALWLDKDPVDDLAALTRRNLVTRLEGDEPRWRLHDVLRRFGLAALAADGKREQALWQQLGLAAVLRLLEINARFESGGDAMVPALAELDQELPLLRAVQAWAAAQIETDAVAAKVASLLPNCSITQLRLVGDEVVVWREMSLRAAEHHGEKAEIARAAGNLGLVYLQRGDLDRAAEMLEKSLTIHEELGDRAGVARNTGNLGLVYRHRGDLDRAAQMHEKSLGIEEELGNRAGMASDYGNLGLVYRERGDLDRAAEMHGKSLAIAEDLGDRPGIARALYNLGQVLKDKGDWAGAAEHFRRSHELADELGMPHIDPDRQALAEAEAHLSGGA